MIMFRSLSAHVNYWQKSGNSCRNLGAIAAVHESAFGTKRTSGRAQSMSTFGRIADITLKQFFTGRQRGWVAPVPCNRVPTPCRRSLL